MPPRATRERSASAEFRNYEWLRVRAPKNFKERVLQLKDPGECADIFTISLTTMFAEWDFGEVYACLDKADKTYSALFMRRFEKEKLDASTIDHPIYERQYLCYTDFHGIPEYYERMKDGRNLYIVTLDVPIGSFQHLLAVNRGGRAISEIEVKPYLHQVYNALEYLHYIDVVHRCVCLKHCLIFPYGRVKLYEYSYARTHGECYGYAGDPKHSAPEMDMEGHYKYGVDWFAFGVLVYVLLLNEYPYPGETYAEVRTKRLSERLYGLPGKTTGQCAMFIKLLLQTNAFDRLGYNHEGADSPAIRNHAWFKDSKSAEWASPDFKNPLSHITPWLGTPVEESKFRGLPEESAADAKTFMYF